MADRESTYVLKFDGEAGTLRSVLSALKSEFRNTVADLEATTKRVQLFGDVETKTKAASDALDAARKRAKELADQLDAVRKSGTGATDDLVKSLAAANREVTSATSAFNRQVDALTKLERQLTAAGVDTSKLAAEQLRLAEALRVATAAQEQAAAKQLLGFKSIGDVQPQIAKLQTAFDTLKNSGTLSQREIAIAHAQLTARIKEQQAEVSKLGTSFSIFGKDVSSILASNVTRFLGFTAVVGAVGGAVTAAVAAAHEFENGLARIGTVADLSEEKLRALGGDVRAVARDLGLDLPEALKSVFELLRSGVPSDNAIEVLRVSGQAAKATLTDLTTTTKVSTLLIDSFGVETKDLASSFDILIRSAQKGGPTLAEFADGSGKLLNAARAANIPLEQLSAVLTVMVDKSNDAGGSINALTKIIIKLGDPDVRAKLRGLGIESTNILEIFTQLGEKGIPLQQIIDLGIASTKTAAGVLSLTNNTKDLSPALDDAATSAGTLDKALAKVAQTPEARQKRLNAAINDLNVSFGEAIGSGSRYADILAKILNKFNELDPASRRTAIQQNALNLTFGATKVGPFLDAIRLLTQILPRFTAAQNNATDGAKKFREEQEKARASSAAELAKAQSDLAALAPKLAKEAAELQGVANRSIAEIDELAAQQIALLDRSVDAQAKTAAQRIAIESKSADDRFAILQKNEVLVTRALEGSLAAQKLTEEAAAKVRLDALAPILKAYTDHYNKLVALAQGYAQKVDSIEQERTSFNRGVAQTLLDISNQQSTSALSALDLYAQKVRQIDTAIANARQAGIDGNIAKAKEFTDQAISLSGTLREVVSKDGRTIISTFESQTTAQTKIKAAAEGYNKALEDAGDSAKDGFAEAKKGIDAVIPVLEDLEQRLKSAKDIIDKGLNLEVNVDQSKLAEAQRQIDELTQPRVVPITFQTTGSPTAPAGGGQPAGGFTAGGLVIDAAQRFARGGPVFRRPGWTKVPGIGNRDTVPAALPIGAYVLRKAVTGFYGDAALGKLARPYATGGSVEAAPRDDFWSRYKDTIQELRTLREASVGEQLAPLGSLTVTLGDWAAKLVDEFIFYSDPHRDQIKKLLDESFDGWLAGIATAKSFHVPNVMSGDLLGILKRYGTGGGVDSVPALLTPGEYVVNPARVAELGTDFFDAVNSMRISREALASFAFPSPPRPPARFAAGGLVGSASATATAGPSSDPLSARASGLTVNIYSQTVDEKTVYRDVIPAIRKAMKRSA